MIVGWNSAGVAVGVPDEDVAVVVVDAPVKYFDADFAIVVEIVLFLSGKCACKCVSTIRSVRRKFGHRRNIFLLDRKGEQMTRVLCSRPKVLN